MSWLVWFRVVVFFVELLNIDLFNYVVGEPVVVDFCGIVYCGMVVRLDDFWCFSLFVGVLIVDCYVSILFGMVLVSTSCEKVLVFVMLEVKCMGG